MQLVHLSRSFAWLLAVTMVACAGRSEGDPLDENVDAGALNPAPLPENTSDASLPNAPLPEGQAPQNQPEPADNPKEEDADPLAEASGEGHAVVAAEEGEPAVKIERAEPPAGMAPEDRVLIVEDNQERYLSRNDAESQGYTVVSLRDDWTPYLFEQHYDDAGRPLQNRYRAIYVGLANDLTDGDGRPLADDEDNYLEVFGIPPSISVIRQRFEDDKTKDCFNGIDYELIGQVRSMTYKDKPRAKLKQEAEDLRAKLSEAQKQAGVDSFEALAEAKPELRAKIAEYDEKSREFRALDEVEKRLECDGHMAKRFGHKKGQLDHGLRLAVRRFQRKHMIYEHTNLRGVTMKTLALKPIETNFQAFRRALTERVVSATSILEDGSASRKGEPDTYEGMDGEKHPVRNLVEEFTNATLLALGAETPEKADAFFDRHPAEDFKWLQVGVKMPPYPEYYSGNMDLSVYVDKGDVWYDPPWNDKGKKISQPRPNMPSFTLYTTYRGHKIRLVRFPTTIGGWRDELSANGYEYYRYKGSDTGPRVIRKIIAGPVWVAPLSTPLRSLAKRKYINGASQGVVNYDEMGPGYLSSYGLVAGYFVIPGRNGQPDSDRGIRAHGTSDFMSIFSAERYSHGCHRLVNHKSVRLYGFMLNHRHRHIDGEQIMNHTRQFLYKDAVYEIRMPSRGFQYTLDPPIPVMVNEGNIKGKAQQPIEGFVKIPGNEYPEDLPDDGKVGGE